MKLEPIQRQRTKHKPVWLFGDIASKLGLSVGQLRGYMSTHPEGRPAPALVNRSGAYYELGAFMAWWDGVKA